MSDEEYKVVIIGAGPSGLALSYYLKKLGVQHLVVEQGETGNSWMHMADALRLVSPLWVNVLPGTWPSFREFFSKTPALTFAAYLKRYQRDHGLPVREQTTVVNVEFDASGALPFRIVTQKAHLRARILVCATGYYGNPYLPDLDSVSDRSIPVLHARDFINVAQLRQLAGRDPAVLIIGKRISAGQLMVELADAGLSVALSTQGPVVARSASLPARMKETAYYFYEKLFIRFFPTIKGNSYPPMDGGRSEELLREGVVKVRPVITQISNRLVHFSDASSAAYDLIICATGYRPHLSCLAGLLTIAPGTFTPQTTEMQSTQMSGLYFMGLDNLRNFRSRTLRGIADDAKWLAREIRKRLKS